MIQKNVNLIVLLGRPAHQRMTVLHDFFFYSVSKRIREAKMEIKMLKVTVLCQLFGLQNFILNLNIFINLFIGRKSYFLFQQNIKNNFNKKNLKAVSSMALQSKLFIMLMCRIRHISNFFKKFSIFRAYKNL